jgi:cytochrome P450
MTTLHMGSRTWVVLNSDRVVHDIINKHGKITTERPSMPIVSDLLSNGKRSVIRPTAEWVEGRRVMHYLLSGTALRTYGDWYETESIRMLASYLREPKSWFAHHYRYATSVLYRLVLGEPFDKSREELDEFQQITIEFITNINRHPVEFFPWLSRLPTFLQFWAPYWKRRGAFHRHIIEKWWVPVEEAVHAGTATPSFVRDTLLHPDTNYKGDREDAMYLANSIMSAGGDNTRMTLNTFLMAMISNPHALTRLQEELDACCGTDDGNLRLPNFSDISSLPFCAAMVKEVLRWRPTVPLAPQHHLTEPLAYEGYLFPPGTDFLINNMALKSSDWDDLDKFRPERYIDGNETNPTHQFLGFGGGRRICAGYRVAQQSLFVAYARIAYCFDIVADGDGKVDDKKLNHQSLTEPFPVKITPRSKAHENLILQEESNVAKPT